jgi:hypothetical protein
VKYKNHNEVAIICRDTLIKKKISLKSLPVVPWDNIVYTFAEGLSGTSLDKKRIAAMFLAVVRLDQRIQAILTPIERELISSSSQKESKYC